MKKSGIILLCLFYFFVACGFHINLHYCGGKLKSISFLEGNEDGCCGNKERSKGCCKDKAFVYEVKANQQIYQKIATPDNPVSRLPEAFFSTTFYIFNPVIALFSVPESHAPPFRHLDPVYLLNGNFRI